MKKSNIPLKTDDQPKIKVITLYQPWASLVVMGYKEYETRSWNTNYRGRLLIHASIKIPQIAKELALQLPFSKYVPDINKLPTGCILGEVSIVKTVTTDVADQMLSAWPDRQRALEEWQFGDYSDGRFAWMLQNPHQWPDPMPVKGMQGLWEIPLFDIDRFVATSLNRSAPKGTAEQQSIF